MSVTREEVEQVRLENLKARGREGGSAPPVAQQPLVFRFPMPMNIANRSGRRTSHWAVEYGKKTQFWAVCDVLQRAGDFPPPPASPLPRAVVHSVMRLGHAMDDDNAMRRHKWVLDWLKTRGYIVDDKRKCIRWAGLPEQIVGRKQDYSITLTLTPESA